MTDVPNEASDRYARLRQLRWWNAETVRNAVAIVAGAGALGNEVVKNLALLGWGNVLLVDFDRVEMSNLTRSILFRAEDVGRPKGEAVAAAVAGINPDLNVKYATGDLRAVLSQGMVRRSDVVFGCLDNVAARLGLSTLAGRVGVPMIDGGLTEWEGTVSFFHPPEGPCFGCGLTKEDLDALRLRHSCPAYAARARAQAGVPTTPVVAAITAALMVQQGLKWVHGLTDSKRLPIGHQLRMDTAYNRFWNVSLWKNADCSFHPARTSAETLSGVTDLASWVDILARVREHLNQPEAVLHLPQPVLESWTCLSCGATEQPEQIVVAGEDVACPVCGKPAAATLFNQVTGEERWVSKTPAETGLPPLTWIAAVGEFGILNIEIAKG